MIKKDFEFVTIFILELAIIFLVWNFLISPLTVINEITELIPSESLEVKKTVEIASSKYELFRDLLLVLLALLAVGAIGMFLFFKRIIEEKTDEYMERTKILLECQQILILCVEKTRSPKNAEEIKSILKSPLTEKGPSDVPIWLDEVIEITRKSLFKARRLNKEEDEEVICLLKNNLAYYLAIARISEEEARKLAEDVYGKANNYPNRGYRWKETYLWVLWRFAKNQEERKKALKIFYELHLQKDKIPNREFKLKLEEYKVFFDQFQIH